MNRSHHPPQHAYDAATDPLLDKSMAVAILEALDQYAPDLTYLPFWRSDCATFVAELNIGLKINPYVAAAVAQTFHLFSSSVAQLESYAAKRAAMRHGADPTVKRHGKTPDDYFAERKIGAFLWVDLIERAPSILKRHRLLATSDVDSDCNVVPAPQPRRM